MYEIANGEFLAVYFGDSTKVGHIGVNAKINIGWLHDVRDEGIPTGFTRKVKSVTHSPKDLSAAPMAFSTAFHEIGYHIYILVPMAMGSERTKKGDSIKFDKIPDLVIPTGFEPISKEPESFILSIELGDRLIFSEHKNSKT